jgi:hypothetical protein
MATPALPPKSMENACCLTDLSPRTLSQKRWISKNQGRLYPRVSRTFRPHRRPNGCRRGFQFEVISWLGKNGARNTRPLNPGGTYSPEFGRVKCVNAIHSSALPCNSSIWVAWSGLGFLIGTSGGGGRNSESFQAP